MEYLKSKITKLKNINNKLKTYRINNISGPGVPPGASGLD